MRAAALFLATVATPALAHSGVEGFHIPHGVYAIAAVAVAVALIRARRA